MPDVSIVSDGDIASFLSSFGASSVLDDPFDESSNRLEKSSPFLPIIAMIPLTGTASFSLTPICKSSPSSYDSNSMVALSVSTSASISPDFIVSPTFTNHEAITPSSMVSLILGILITSAIIKVLN